MIKSTPTQIKVKNIVNKIVKRSCPDYCERTKKGMRRFKWCLDIPVDTLKDRLAMAKLANKIAKALEEFDGVVVKITAPSCSVNYFGVRDMRGISVICPN